MPRRLVCPRPIDCRHGPADDRAGRAAAALPQHEFRRQQFDARAEARVGDAIEHAGAGPLAQLAHRLVDRGQRRVEQAAGIDVVKADHGHLVGDAHPRRGERPHDADGHLVVGAHDRLRQRPALPGQQVFPGPLATADAEDPLDRADQLALRITAEHVLQGESPLAGVGRVRRPVDMEQAPHAVFGDEVGDDGGRAREVVGGHHVGRPLARGPGDDDHGDPGRQALDVTGGDESLADEDPVDLARQRVKPAEVRLAEVLGLHERDQERPVVVADERLDPAQYLVVVQQAHVLDVVVLDLAL